MIGVDVIKRVGGRMRGKRRVTNLTLGIVFIVVALAAGVALFSKTRIETALRSGDMIKVDLAQDYKLQPYTTQAKISGIPIGVVTSVKKAVDGSAIVSIKVNKDVPAKLRTVPSAVVRPTTLLGGRYYIDLVPGGEPGVFSGEIPRTRTQLPVELDKVLSALQPSTLSATRKTLDEFDATLNTSSRAAIDQLVADAPSTLRPAAVVANALLGTRPASDLTQLVKGLESTAAGLTSQQGELQSIIDNLATTSTVLGQRAQDLSTTLAELPSTLDATNAGLQSLDKTLRTLRDTAGPAIPVADQLSALLKHADPAIARARPLVDNLNQLLTDARPLVQQLVPTSQVLTTVLNDVRGPVLDRVSHPIMNTLLSPYHGSGVYNGTGNDTPFYKELAYMLADLDRASSNTDANGASIAFEPGVAPGSLGGLPINLAQLFSHLTQIGVHEVGK